MNILLDTHIALWAITDSPHLNNTARQWIENPKSIIWISVASLWEITIKHSIGRGEMPISGEQALHYFIQSGFNVLNIQAEHVSAVANLPTHHQDPFDKLLIAQAITEPMRLITHDKTVAKYSDQIIGV